MTPKTQLVSRCWSSIIRSVAYVMSAGITGPQVNCHRKAGHKGEHRGWSKELTGREVRVTWANEER